ncbi:LysR family transcriptional regulator [Singulisphaera acidiphila]|uniref:Transcriptional regulator n=1 Tax=Singulisphaera acidiphila (strain ATCC BAA-1392 / DSM 18658 / VKM B-2454 / MOB10) TaxID=886293 RepID=L0D7J5_SINAD|nr:LysR family transcriptional regulator [Singulisphaera acidiphila]AGA24803.1 transcriptional regulator [Singulisphaera acidiphila DSM 18658]
MPSPTAQRHAYKEISLPQIRCFCDAIRLGSFKAAAKSLGLSHPTVLSQVHALEHHLGVKLVETHARGCRPTADGRLLAVMVAPLVAGFHSLEHTFQEVRGKEVQRLIVATTPRILVDDLPMCVVEFSKNWPNVQIHFEEMRMEEIPEAVETGKADLGLTTTSSPTPGNAWIAFEPAYELEVVLITPKDHPLARRRRVSARDLAEFPLVNAPPGILDPSVSIALKMLNAFQAEPRRVEVANAAAILRYVEMGFGVGLTLRVPSHLADPKFHERSLSRELGRVKVHLVWRNGSLMMPHARAFADLVKDLLNRKTSQPKTA